MEKLIAACGNDCAACPRYVKHPYEKTADELRHTAELWMRIGYRDHLVTNEEISCTGCKPENWCRYQVIKCCVDKDISTCASCQEYPCDNIRACFEITKSFEPKCREVCTDEEYRRLKKAFFEKERNLNMYGYSRKISERQWNLPDKGELESRREETYIDDIIQKDHIQRKILEHLDGIQTVFDGGAGSGRFSILLAKQGCHVTHFDISQPMIDKAKELAEAEGVLDRITFVKGALEELQDYKDRSFDLVMSFDAPISYTYPNQNQVIGELVRIARKRVMFSVSSRLGSLPYLCNPVQKTQFILDEHSDDPFVQWCVANRSKMIEGFHFDRQYAEQVMADGLLGGQQEIEEFEAGNAPWCITYTFMPDELERILLACGVKNIQLSGPGAFGRTIPREILVKLMSDPKQKKDFLDFCYRFDSNPYVCGMGKDNLMAIGDV